MAGNLIVDSKGTVKEVSKIQPRGSAVLYDPPKVEDRSFDKWQAVMERRQAERREIDPFISAAEVAIETDKPIYIALFGDIHGGGQEVRYDMLGKDMDIIRRNPQMYAMALGDLADAFVWMSAAQDDIASLAEQFAYLQSILETLNGRLVCGMVGNHEVWYQGSGPVGYYHDFVRKYNAPLFNGVSALRLIVGKTPYNIVLSHALPGSSIYNNAHPEMRASREVQGADIYIAGHTHRKGIGQQSSKQANLESITQTMISTGAYKASDTYSLKKGFPPMDKKQLGAVVIKLDPHAKQVTTFWNLEEAEKDIETNGV